MLLYGRDLRTLTKEFYTAVFTLKFYFYATICSGYRLLFTRAMNKHIMTDIVHTRTVYLDIIKFLFIDQLMHQ